MRRGPEPDPEQQRRQTRANELMLGVAALLLGEARRVGAFLTEDAELGAQLARIDVHLDDDGRVVLQDDEIAARPTADYVVEVSRPEEGRVDLACRYGSHSLSARLGIDGVLDHQMSGVGISFDDAEQKVELSTEEQEVMRLANANIEGDRAGARDHFQGGEFVRAFAVTPQPASVIQILAVELYRDGLIVCYAYDDPVEVGPMLPFEFYERAGIEPPIDDLIAEAKSEGGNLAPNVAVSDDVGTDYRGAFGGSGGVQTVQGETCFTPAVPAEAKLLEISTYAGTVSVEL